MDGFYIKCGLELSVTLAIAQAIIYGARPVFIPWVVYVGTVVDVVAKVLVFLVALWLLCRQINLHQSFVLTRLIRKVKVQRS